MKEGYVVANGIRTRYLESGSGEPLLLIHGGNYGQYCSANDWDTNIDSLGKHFHVYAIDKIGCGFTDNPKSDKDYVIGATVQHAYDFLRAMKIDRAHVAGHSRGGYATTRLALEHPEIAKTLIIVDSSTLMTPPNPMYDQWDREAEKIPDLKQRYRYIVTANSYSGTHVTDDFVNITVKIVSLAKTQEAAAKMAAGLKKQFNEDLVARQKETHEWIRAGRLKCPTLIMWAYTDPSATMERCGVPCMNLVMPNVPKSEMHIVNQAGHYCYREQPQAFDNAVVDFIRRYSK
ncbi:MAG: alpha/beta hydrolase [Thaumarchaeota archaeon]|nr:alpha/beta hydrolase [Nitrososphaerota archaeon]